MILFTVATLRYLTRVCTYSILGDGLGWVVHFRGRWCYQAPETRSVRDLAAVS